MSRRSTPHQKRNRSRERRVLDRAIVRAVVALLDERSTHATGELTHAQQSELVGLARARRRVHV